MRTIAEITIWGRKLEEILKAHKAWTRGDGGERAYMRGADLRGAYLRGADLRGAYLSGADLREADGIYMFGPIGREKRLGYAVQNDAGTMFQLGCFWGSLEETCAAIVNKYGANSLYERQVRLADEIIREGK